MRAVFKGIRGVVFATAGLRGPYPSPAYQYRVKQLHPVRKSLPVVAGRDQQKSQRTADGVTRWPIKDLPCN